ncbi:MAG TPA: glycosyl transferase, partial [Thiobacillus sp.]
MTEEIKLTVLQLLPSLQSGGVERGTLEVAQALVEHGHRALVISASGRLVAPLTKIGAEHFAWPIGKKSLRT